MMSSFRKEITVLRQGVPLDPPPLASVQPALGGEQMRQLPGDWLPVRVYQLFTDTELFAEDLRDPAGPIPYDVVVLDDGAYRVLGVNPWKNDVLPHYEIVISRGQDETDVTVWPAPVPDGSGGFISAAPVVVPGRWQDKQELFIDASGEEARSAAMTWIPRDLEIGAYVAPGAHLGVADPTTLPTARRVRGFFSLPGWASVPYERKGWLQ